MEKIILKFGEPRKLEEYGQLPDESGIYIHFIKEMDKNRVIYVGKANNLKDRNKDHLSNCNKDKYLLFKKTSDGLYFSYLPGYDGTNKPHDFDKFDIYVVSAICKGVRIDDKTKLEPIEGALIIHLWRSPEARKYLTTYKQNYRLRDAEIKIELPEELVLEGIPERIITPKN